MLSDVIGPVIPVVTLIAFMNGRLLKVISIHFRESVELSRLRELKIRKYKGVPI